jgi:hypothetical protein
MKNVQGTPGFRSPTSIEKHRRVQAKQEVERGRCKSNEQGKRSDPSFDGGWNQRVNNDKHRNHSEEWICLL